MTVSIQHYRIRISSYHISGRNLQRKFRNLSTKSTNPMKSFLFLYLIIVGSCDCGSFPVFRNTTESIKLYSNKSSQPTSILNTGRTTHMLRWSYFSSNTNALNHSLTGNRRRLGYKLAFWNCRKGLIGNSEQDTPKLVDIKRFVEKHQPHVFGIIEANLHLTESRLQRKTTVTLNQIEEKLKIDGYTIELPDTWSSFGQARIMVYVHEDLNYKRKPMDQSYSDLPNVTLEIGLGRERKSIVNVFYREWTGGVNGESSQDSQVRRWARQISYWKSLNSQNRDFVALPTSVQQNGMRLTMMLLGNNCQTWYKNIFWKSRATKLLKVTPDQN